MHIEHIIPAPAAAAQTKAIYAWRVPGVTATSGSKCMGATRKPTRRCRCFILARSNGMSISVGATMECT
jgi:hypothetical protein